VHPVEALFCEYFSAEADIETIPESFRFWPVFGPKEPAELVEHGAFVRGFRRAYAGHPPNPNTLFLGAGFRNFVWEVNRGGPSFPLETDQSWPKIVGVEQQATERLG
jgi:hypothetical protein